MVKATDLVGQRFGRLIVLERDTSVASKYTMWKCRCDCGSEHVVRASHLVAGSIRSCGCLALESRTKHGACKSGSDTIKTYHIWVSMKQRCDNPNQTEYSSYGGRGISYDPRWSVFAEFFSDMGKCPVGYSIERIDVNGDYTKDNCTWIPLRQQQDNRQGTIYIEYQGERKTLKKWAHDLRIPYRVLKDRLQSQWSVKDAFNTPVGEGQEHNHNRHWIEYGGENLIMEDWARKLGIASYILGKRLNKLHWSVEKTFTTPVRKFRR